MTKDTYDIIIKLSEQEKLLAALAKGDGEDESRNELEW